MKKISTAIILVLASAFTTGAFAATKPEVLSTSEVGTKQSIGVVSVSGLMGSPDDAIRALQQKAEKLGGSSVAITSLDTPGDSSLWTGTAQVYR